MSDSAKTFALYCVKGIKADKKRIKNLLDNSLMLVTALTPKIGYDKAAYIAKTAYKNKVQKLFKSNKAKDAWEGLKILSCFERKGKKTSFSDEDPCIQSERLNNFFCRFDQYDFKNEAVDLLEDIKSRDISQGNEDTNSFLNVNVDQVFKVLKNLKTGKASGPDGISAMLLKSCARQLSYPLSSLFNSSLQSGVIPKTWKLSEVIPVPKKKFPKLDNDFRPVALTSIPMKCLETIINFKCISFQ